MGGGLMSEANGNGRRYFVLNRPEGEARFAMLAPSDFEKLAGLLRTHRKTQLMINLKLTDIDGETALKKLDELDSRKIRYSDIVEWVNTHEGMFHFVLRSIQKEKPDATDADVDAVIHDNAELLKVAAGVAGFIIEKKAEDESPAATAIGAAMQT
jgi:hypothetical protein